MLFKNLLMTKNYCIFSIYRFVHSLNIFSIANTDNITDRTRSLAPAEGIQSR